MSGEFRIGEHVRNMNNAPLNHRSSNRAASIDRDWFAPEFWLHPMRDEAETARQGEAAQRQAAETERDAKERARSEAEANERKAQATAQAEAKQRAAAETEKRLSQAVRDFLQHDLLRQADAVEQAERLRVLPSQVEGVSQPIHALCIVAMGMPIFDNLDLEAVSAEADKRQRWDFHLSAAPLAVVGGTGSPFNPIATF